jgi:heme-degrading monooxygenase HmoA
MTIKRVWHGWTTPQNAPLYEQLLYDEVFPGIEAKQIPGYRSIELWRRDFDDEVEFSTVMTFDSLQNVIDFQGEDYKGTESMGRNVKPLRDPGDPRL